jgi:hypothetical protein
MWGAIMLIAGWAMLRTAQETQERPVPGVSPG